jgi:hypothetical protein
VAAEEPASVDEVLANPFAALAARTRVIRPGRVPVPGSAVAAATAAVPGPGASAQRRPRVVRCPGAGVPGTGPGRLVAR